MPKKGRLCLCSALREPAKHVGGLRASSLHMYSGTRGFLHALSEVGPCVLQ